MAYDKWPSVSTVLKRFTRADPLLYWAWKQGRAGVRLEDARTPAANLGKVIEAQIQARVFGQPKPKLPRKVNADLVESGVLAWDKWTVDHGVKIRRTQVALESNAHRFTGRLDMIGEVDGELSIIELKVSGGIYLDHLLQCGAYRVLADEAPIDRPDVATLVRIDRDNGTLHPKRFDRKVLADAGRMFLLLRQAYEYDRPLNTAVNKAVAA